MSSISDEILGQALQTASLSALLSEANISELAEVLGRPLLPPIAEIEELYLRFLERGEE